MTEQEQPKNDFMHKLALQIVERRNLVFLIVILGTIFTIFSRSWVKVESDLTTYLPKTSETRMGLDIMEKEFTTYGSADVMVANITPDEADQLNDELAGLRGIQMIEYDDTTAHYNNVSALYSITFDYPEDDDQCLETLESVKEYLKDYDIYVSTSLGNTQEETIEREVNVIMVYVAIIIVVVLIFTSQTYAEVPVLLLTFVVGMILNMGTNFLLGTISFVSNSVTNILQLALSLDYAIIFCNHFKEEHETLPLKEAVIESLAKSIPEISSSSLTTIGGLVAMLFMQFKIGPDMAICLIKAILFSMLSVFVVMPGLLMLFGPYMSKTKHRNFVPKISFVGRYAYKTRKIVPIVFAVVLVFAYHFQTQCPYAYGYGPIKTPVLNETQIADNMIDENFTKSNLVALVVPKNDDYRVEAAMIKELESHDEVDHTRGLSNIEAMDGYTLTDSLNPRELSELVGMDYEVMQLLYSAYAVENNQYGEFVQGLDKYKVPLFDMLIFLKDQLDSHNISLDDTDEASLNDIFSQLDMAQKQLKSDRYSRMVVYLNLPEESDETFAFLTEMRNIVGKYYDGDYYVVGNSTSSRDLSSSFVKDNLVISILSSLFVILVLLFTFQSAGLPILLIACILGSVWINFSFPTLANQPLYFLGYLIVQSIQMGANIDYAIVISSHYQELKATMTHKEAIVEALNASFPTIFTSGTILSAAALLIGNISTNPVISILGTCLGRGTIISIVIVLGVLPATLVLSDSIINRTSFKMKGIELPTRTASGTMYVSGHLRGQVSGVLDGEFTGTIRGDMHAIVSTSTQVKKLDEAEGGEDNA